MSEEWVETTLGDHFDFIRGISYKSSQLRDVADVNNRPMVNLKCVERGGGYRQVGLKFYEGPVKESHEAESGSLLIACTDLTRAREVVGAPMLVPSELHRAVFSLDLVLLKPSSDSVLTPFAHLLLQTEKCRTYMQTHSSGTTVIHLKTKEVPDFSFALPPLPVQRRIVDLMTHLDAHIANLQAERDEIVALASSVRRTSFTNLEAPMLPANVMFEMVLGRQKSARQSVGDFVFPYIRAANITANGLNLRDVQKMNFEPREQEKYGLRDDDILLVEGGTVGLTSRWRNEVEGFVGFDKHVIRLRAKHGITTSEYALQWARWSKETGAFDEQATGITIRALGFARASAMPVPDICVEQQEALCAPLQALESERVKFDAELRAMLALRQTLLTNLLGQSIPLTSEYDVFLRMVA